jgi:hypothetical protein
MAGVVTGQYLCEADVWVNGPDPALDPAAESALVDMLSAHCGL